MIKNIFIFLIKIYQFMISPLLEKHCRFYPSCSQYSLISIREKGAVVGCVRSIKRILKCHPWNIGGVDLP